ncbi:hypothetical protein CMI41_00505 [Candidatus Pacearchaeota archaeon]|nr:hypothetical protein [Candidatus Pacearchaeota archaeon]|tara:strand:+ start:488 stop:730 length:243 start_codon:yes stop_codon:yes gene_type:complete
MPHFVYPETNTIKMLDKIDEIIRNERTWIIGGKKRTNAEAHQSGRPQIDAFNRRYRTRLASLIARARNEQIVGTASYSTN